MAKVVGMRDGTLPEVITIGEAMALVTPAVAEPIEHAEDFRLDTGGAESNVASHLAALGRKAAWVGQLGDDFIGRRVLRLIAERGVDTSWVQLHDRAPTGVYFKDPGNGVQYYRQGSAASMMEPSMLTRLPLETASLVHLSGITPVLSSSCAAMIDAVVDQLSALPTQVSFDVNFRPGLWDARDAAAVLLDLSRRVDLVFVGLDEAAALWGTHTPDEVRELLPEPRHLIVKDGDVGATEYSVDGKEFQPAIPTAVVEVVGAGDAFAAGYLNAHLASLPAAERLQAGHQRASLTLKSTSDFPQGLS